MIRVLQKTATLGPGGIQRFLINMQSNMDREKVQYDYFLNTLEPNFFTSVAIEMGSRIYGREKNEGNPIKKLWSRYSLFYKVIKTEKYSIVHIDEGITMTALSAVVAKIAGAKVIIAHSHNDHLTDKFPLYIKYIINPISRFVGSTVATDFFACSTNAGKWAYTKKLMASGKVKVINNGIDSEKYEYNQEIANKYKKKIGIENCFVVGHVGRFFYQKNHKFILEVFSYILMQKKNSKLLLVGDGELRKDMEDYASKLGIRDSVIFYGLSDEVNYLLQTMDAFIFPSIFEGLGIVAIESQAASVQTFCAKETIAKEVEITEYCHYIPLSDGPKKWADVIIAKSMQYDRHSTIHQIKKANFDVSSVAQQLETFYLAKEF